MTVCEAFPLDQRLLITVVAAAVALVGGWVLYRGFAPLRRADAVSRFFARTFIIGGAALVFFGVLRGMGGECVFAGPTKGNGFNSKPLTRQSIVLFSLGLGVMGGIFAPAVLAQRGKKLEW